MRHGTLLLCLALAFPIAALAEDAAGPTPLERSVEQLRHAVGTWNVTTEFLGEDGAVARTVEGIYEFRWVVPDRVVQGRSDMPSLGQSSGILFYVREATSTIEMVSVGADGRLWIMSGPLGEETRTTAPFETADGGRAQLRFTRYRVTADTFESKMEYTDDGGVTWKPGNHQTFRRAKGD